MKIEELFERVESDSRLASIKTVTMYFGGCVGMAQNLERRGFIPNPIGRKFLIVSSDIETAKNIANQNNCNSIVEIKHIPLDKLEVDFNQKNAPADRWDALKRIENGENIIMRLVKPIYAGRFKFLNKLKNGRKNKYD